MAIAAPASATADQLRFPPGIAAQDSHAGVLPVEVVNIGPMGSQEFFAKFCPEFLGNPEESNPKESKKRKVEEEEHGRRTPPPPPQRAPLIPDEFLSPPRKNLATTPFEVGSPKEKLGKGTFAEVTSHGMETGTPTKKSVAVKRFFRTEEAQIEFKRSQGAPDGAAIKPVYDPRFPGCLLMHRAYSDLKKVLTLTNPDHPGILQQNTPPSPKDLISEQYRLQLVHSLLTNHAAFQRAGVVHQDLKLENILLDASTSAKPADLMSVTRISDLNSRSHLQGSVWDTAPELLNKESHYTDKVETYSYGLIALHLVMGMHPWDVIGNSPNLKALKEKIIQRYLIPDASLNQRDFKKIGSLIHRYLQAHGRQAEYFPIIKEIALRVARILDQEINTHRFPTALSSHPVVQLLLQCVLVDPHKRPETEQVLQAIEARFHEITHTLKEDYGITHDMNMRAIMEEARSFHREIPASSERS